MHRLMREKNAADAGKTLQDRGGKEKKDVMDVLSQAAETADRYSLRGRVFHRLRDDILNGRYREFDELREAAIAEEMGVSRTPVREALRQLELEGLVQIIPNKGAYVTGITVKDVQDIYAIRSLLEGLCARWATQNISEEQMEALRKKLEKFSGRQVKLSQRLDPGVLGGLRVEMEGKSLDGTVKGRLQGIAEKLNEMT